MHQIDLAYVGRGLHEELVAYITDQEELYADEGVFVALRDGTGWDMERKRRSPVIGVGGTLLHRLTTGTPWVALNVNTHSPLFWFLGREGLTSLSDLAGKRLAVHSPKAPPGCFARIALRQAGLDPDRDLETVVHPPGDYGTYLRWLHEGKVDAAYVGSTMAPEAIAAEFGYNVLAWVGDHFKIPTVGVVVDPTYIDPESPAIQGVVRAQRRALQFMQDDPEKTVRYIRSFLGRCTDEEARAHYEKFFKPHFNTDGQADLAIGEAAIKAVAAELGVPVSVKATDFYRTDLTK